MRLLRHRHGDDAAPPLLARKPDLTREEAQAGARRQPVPLRHARARPARDACALAGGRRHERRCCRGASSCKAGGALVVGFTVPSIGRARSACRAPRPRSARRSTPARSTASSPSTRDGTVTIYSGKVDLGQGLRIAIPQMAAEELGIGVERIALIEGDTALTPDQGPTAGSSGIMRGGVQIRQAAATAREALIALASARSSASRRPSSTSSTARCGRKRGGAGIRFGELVGDKRFDAQGGREGDAAGIPRTYAIVGKPLAAARHPGQGHRPPRLRARLRGRRHAARPRRAAAGGRREARRRSTRASIAVDSGRARRPRSRISSASSPPTNGTRCPRRALLKAQWSESAPLLGARRRARVDAQRPVRRRRDAGAEGRRDAGARRREEGRRRVLLADAVARARWGRRARSPTCATARRRSGRASQATHRFRETIAKALALPKDAVRVVYLDGAGCYGMNGHDDAAADAALLSKAVGRPVRVQWIARRTSTAGIRRGRRSCSRSKARVDARRQDRRMAHRDVDPEGDGEPAEHAAAGARRRRHRADAGHHDGPHQPERRSAVRGAAPGGASCTG